MQVPVGLSFGLNDSSVAKLQALSACVSFVAVATASPMWRFYKTSTAAIPASTFTQVSFGQVAIDTDGVWTSPGIATIITQGYYCCEAQLPYEGTAATWVPQTIFQWTAGPSNPHYSSGTQQYFGGHSSATFTAAGTDFCQNISDKCPVVCFPGDTIVVKTWCSIAATINFESNANAVSGWFAPSFSGRWVRTGSLFTQEPDQIHGVLPVDDIGAAMFLFRLAVPDGYLQPSIRVAGKPDLGFGTVRVNDVLPVRFGRKSIHGRILTRFKQA